MMYDLPTAVEIGGQLQTIRSDYRAALDILLVFSDDDLSDEEKLLAALDIFYPDFLDISNECLQEAARQMTWFLDAGDAGDDRKRPRLMDWEQDFQLVVAPVNRVLGGEIRAMPYLHWWSFLSAYYEIGDCMFAHIVRIRKLKARGKPLDKTDREFYRENRRIVDLKTRYTESESDALDLWLGKRKTAPEGAKEGE